MYDKIHHKFKKKRKKKEVHSRERESWTILVCILEVEWNEIAYNWIGCEK